MDTEETEIAANFAAINSYNGPLRFLFGIRIVDVVFVFVLVFAINSYNGPLRFLSGFWIVVLVFVFVFLLVFVFVSLLVFATNSYNGPLRFFVLFLG